MTNPTHTEIVRAEHDVAAQALAQGELTRWRRERAADWSRRALATLSRADSISYTKTNGQEKRVLNTREIAGKELRKEIMELERHALALEERAMQMIAPELREVVLPKPGRDTKFATPRTVDPATAELLRRRRERQAAKEKEALVPEIVEAEPLPDVLT